MAGILHPTLSQLVPFENVPNELEAIRDALQTIFDEIYVTNLIVGKSYQGDSGFYTMTLTTYDSLGIDLPIGDDLKLVLNPTIQGTTQLPIRFDYSWIVLKYIKNFSTDSFDNTARSVLNILFDLAQITPSVLLQEAIGSFYPGSTYIDDFLIDFNSVYNQNITVPQDPTLTPNEQIDFIANEIQVLGLDVLQVINDMQIESQSDSFDRLKQLFKNYFAQIGENISDVIRLNFNVVVEELSAGLQFPRKWLVPVYTGAEPVQGLQIDDPLPGSYFSILKFNVGTLEYSSKNGFQFNQLSSFDLNRSMIGNTGLIIEFDGLKVDLSRNSNIPEADADGRPEDFMGAYANYVAVTLPKRWFNNIDNTTLQIAGRNLLVGTGGVSGTIALETVGGQPNNGAAYMNLKIGNWEVGFNYFDLTFKQNAIVESNIAGRLKVPKLKDAQGNAAEIYLNGHINESGDFNLTASEPEGIPFTLFNFVTFNFLTLELGRENDKFYIGTSCQIWFENQVMAKLIGDQVIEIPQLRVYDNGTIEIVGGNGFLPLNISLNLGPIEMAVTGVHYGSTQLEYNGNMRKYNYWGFDGAISINPFDVRRMDIKRNNTMNIHECNNYFLTK